MTPERLAILDDAITRRQPDLTVLMDNVNKPRNVAAVIRTCDAVGISKVHCVYPHDRMSSFGGTAMGADRYVEKQLHDDALNAVSQLQAEGKQVLAAHLSDSAVDFRDIDYTKPTCIVLGQEKRGVPEATLAAVDQHIIIPMLGLTESLNVSVAAALILFEAQRQRMRAGMYTSGSKMSDEERRRLLFCWTQPKLKYFCDEKRIPYPPVDEYGELVNPSQWYASIREQQQS
ncbi:tRNA (guanosine(18)-2'-O)-methyltransferase TrmH [Pelagibaculum spongiae]|uniref:tRNA (guanosine(18)-2'-O)-methyltransferase n=1 Tax=Pelagibaculum spongiae TaxID=2080658 RepID=A0A2V1GSW3_9GAMM|nr:tRNA (guanosine(18)-2'-O)-methyltransferase TrmH [Pelagibaculum spongiae]PVZ68382.1 tRNA (guanosine(18)-2'-O)-methyltransferase TrmH [Pelagibaculum spongiae]